jgi:hypothetical protein
LVKLVDVNLQRTTSLAGASLGYAPPERLAKMNRRIDEGAAEAGRKPEEIRRAYNISGNIGAEGDGLLEGPVSRWVETLTGFVLEHDMDTFIYWPSGDHERQVELFADEVVPAVREATGRGAHEAR